MSRSQRRAVDQFRTRQRAAGIGRFEVAAPVQDKELIRDVARRLTDDGAEAEKLRSGIRGMLAADPLDEVGSVWRTLRQSPLVGTTVKFRRDRSRGRKVGL